MASKAERLSWIERDRGVLERAADAARRSKRRRH
jgi:hypothetical protein